MRIEASVLLTARESVLRASTRRSRTCHVSVSTAQQRTALREGCTEAVVIARSRIKKSSRIRVALGRPVLLNRLERMETVLRSPAMSDATVLIIEDEPHIRRAMKRVALVSV